MTTRHTTVDTTLGELTLVAAGDALTGVYFEHHWYRPAVASFGSRVAVSSDDVLRAAATQLHEYLDGRRRSFELPLRADGDDFQIRVWALLADIPYGARTTYQAIAERLGDRTLAQRVGAAVGRNPLSLIVPCHRVVGKDGRLVGYAGGLRRKQALLDLEEPAEVAAGRLF